MTHGQPHHLIILTTTVTVFDSSITPEPFLDTLELEKLQKRQQKAEEMSS